MRSPLHALIWDSFRYAGLARLSLLAACLLPLVVYASIGSVFTDPGEGMQRGDPVMLLLEVSMMSFVLFILLLGTATSYATMPQLYTKPLSNLSIAAWRMLGGAVLLAVQVGLLVALYNSLFNAGWPMAGAILFAIATWFAAQPFCCLAGKNISGTLVTMVPIALMCAWFMTRYKPLGGGQRDWDEITVPETLQLLAVIGLFGWSTVHCVGLARRGDGLRWFEEVGNWFNKLFQWELMPTSGRRPFRSAQQAMFWSEWRWKGWALPAAMLLLLAIIVPAELYRSLSWQSYYDAVCGVYLGTTFIAMIMGVINGFQLESLQISAASGKSTRLNEIDELGSFHATRPVTDAQLSRSNLWVCLASICLTTAMWLLFVTPALIAAAGQGQLQQLFVRHPLFVVPLVGVFMWATMSNMTSVTSTGRTVLLSSGFIVAGLTFAALLSLLAWIGNEHIEQMVLQALAVVFTLTLMAFAAWSYARALQLGFVTRGGAAIVLGVALAMIAIGCFWLPTISVNAVMGLLCTAVLCVLPWATTPLATRWNRHR